MSDERDYRRCLLCGLMAFQHSPKVRRCPMGSGTFLSDLSVEWEYKLEEESNPVPPLEDWIKRLMEKWAPPGSVFPVEEK